MTARHRRQQRQLFASIVATPFIVFSSLAVAQDPSSYCMANGGATAVDLSSPTNEEFLKKMREIGVKTIIRYYDYKAETIRGKTLHRAERNLIASGNFSMAVVFQHNNDRFASFTSQRGAGDAARSLELAKENAQTRGSAIYFGVDGGWKSAEQLKGIEAYFNAAKAKLAGSGYRIGVYGGGLVCKTLIAKKLADLCWLANAKSWPGYRNYYAGKEWRLAQTLSTNCGGLNVDFNLPNGKDSDYGQFGP